MEALLHARRLQNAQRRVEIDHIGSTELTQCVQRHRCSVWPPRIQHGIQRHQQV
jgi:hypothetical protein